ncbi:MAG TPA: ATP synthase F1 subunit delta [Actinomycetota bacterium]|nr:ATP synthase F1 subunit delta [Actinomycetota bacterium]
MPGGDGLIRGYAEALFSVAEAEAALDAVGDELFSFAKVLEQNTPLRQALTDPALPVENKKATIREILGERAHRLTGTLLGLVVESGRARELPRIVEELVALAAERRQNALAEVRTAVPLSEQQRAKIAEALSRATGRSIEVKAVVDPTVIGGVLARVGDEVFDGSIRTRLSDAKQHLGSE